MTAAHGIVHSERTPEYLVHSQLYMHELQIWAALPKALEQMEPQFPYNEEKEIPRWT
jgi:redox-sensitive bicupin YhaK (pirin superfamily)